MTTLSKEIIIMAPIEICFDAARCIDYHPQTVWKHTHERIAAGRRTGLFPPTVALQLPNVYKKNSNL